MSDADRDRLTALAARKRMKRPALVRELLRQALDHAEAEELEQVS